MTAVYLTDGPLPYDRVERVDLHIVSISVSLTADTGGVGGDTTGANFTTVAEPNRRYNILELQNGTTASLGEAELPAGLYRAVRMVLDTDSSSITMKDGSVFTGETSPGIAWQSSAGRPTLNAIVHDAMAVSDTGAIIVIDFDVGKSFFPVQAPDSLGGSAGFAFSPWMRAVNLEQTGTVGGQVYVDSAGLVPMPDATVSLLMGYADQPEGTWAVMATGGADENGLFRMAFVSPNTVFAPRTYILRVEAPSGSIYGSLLLKDVLVEVGVVTALGALVLPLR